LRSISGPTLPDHDLRQKRSITVLVFGPDFIRHSVVQDLVLRLHVVRIRRERW
jgi:hypothetical protein